MPIRVKDHRNKLWTINQAKIYYQIIFQPICFTLKNGSPDLEILDAPYLPSSKSWITNHWTTSEWWNLLICSEDLVWCYLLSITHQMPYLIVVCTIYNRHVIESSGLEREMVVTKTALYTCPNWIHIAFEISVMRHDSWVLKESTNRKNDFLGFCFCYKPKVLHLHNPVLNTS